MVLYKLTFIMLVIYLLTFHLEMILNFFKNFGFGLILFVFVFVPIFFKLNYPLQRSLIFLSFVNRPSAKDLKNPNKSGIPNIRNFYLTTEEKIQLGVWHILPNNTEVSLPENKDLIGGYYEKLLGNGQPIIIYMHGNSGARSSEHRVQLYKVFWKLQYHVITFDYRNYADSTRMDPTEPGLVSDGIFIYKWVLSIAKNSPIYIWGHSLGTGVSTHAVDKLTSEGFKHINGLILESPFNNIRDEIREHPFSFFHRYCPFYEYFFLDPVNANGIYFENDRHLANFSIPVLILHAKDDLIVPFILGQRLYETAKQLRPKSTELEFVPFDGKYRYGHKCIYRAPELGDIITKFVNKHQ